MSSIYSPSFGTIIRMYFSVALLAHFATTMIGGPDWLKIPDGGLLAMAVGFLVMEYVDRRFKQLEEEWNRDPDKTRVTIEIVD